MWMASLHVRVLLPNVHVWVLAAYGGVAGVAGAPIFHLRFDKIMLLPKCTERPVAASSKQIKIFVFTILIVFLIQNSEFKIQNSITR
jgi:hypothetical protein